MGFWNGFSQEGFSFGPIPPFFIDQAQTVEAVWHIRLCEHKLFEDLFGGIEITCLDEIEPLIPPFDIIFFLKRTDIWILLSYLLKVV